MAYWKGKNTISPVKQEVKKKVALEEREVIKTGPKPDPSKLDTNTTKEPTLPKMPYIDPKTREETDTYPG